MVSVLRSVAGLRRGITLVSEAFDRMGDVKARGKALRELAAVYQMLDEALENLLGVDPSVFKRRERQRQQREEQKVGEQISEDV